MIKTGILGADTMVAGELIRILINHPDVDLRTVASVEIAGTDVALAHRGLVGDLNLRVEADLSPEGLDVVMLCGEPWMARRWMEQHSQFCTDNEVRIIDLTGAFRNGEFDMTYGLPEFNRKAMVRGATRVSLPSPVAMAVELALFPLAKNMLLSSDVAAAVSIASTEQLNPNTSTPLASPYAATEVSTRLDPIAPIENRPDGSDAAREIAATLRCIQPSFRGAVYVNLSRNAATPRGITASVLVSSSTSLTELRRLYDEAYHDHNFTYTVDSLPTVLDVANTNKCLIHFDYPADLPPLADFTRQRLRITAVIDNLLKGAAGNAVHVLNLLFGLSERTGLALKASAY